MLLDINTILFCLSFCGSIPEFLIPNMSAKQVQRSVVDFWHVIQQVMISDAVQGSSFLGSGPKGFDDLCFHTNREFSPTSPSSYPPSLTSNFCWQHWFLLYHLVLKEGYRMGLLLRCTSIQGWIHGYISRVRVGRSSAGEGHKSIWAGAVGSKSSKTPKK